MNAYAIALVKILNPEKMQEYSALAEPSFAKYGGELSAKGAVAEVLAGSADLQVVAVMKFPSMEKLDQWYESDDYQKAVPIREEASNMTILKVKSAA